MELLGEDPGPGIILRPSGDASAVSEAGSGPAVRPALLFLRQTRITLEEKGPQFPHLHSLPPYAPVVSSSEFSLRGKWLTVVFILCF